MKDELSQGQAPEMQPAEILFPRSVYRYDEDLAERYVKGDLRTAAEFAHESGDPVLLACAAQSAEVRSRGSADWRVKQLAGLLSRSEALRGVIESLPEAQQQAILGGELPLAEVSRILVAGRSAHAAERQKARIAARRALLEVERDLLGESDQAELAGTNPAEFRRLHYLGVTSNPEAAAVQGFTKYGRAARWAMQQSAAGHYARVYKLDPPANYWSGRCRDVPSRLEELETLDELGGLPVEEDFAEES